MVARATSASIAGRLSRTVLTAYSASSGGPGVHQIDGSGEGAAGGLVGSRRRRLPMRMPSPSATQARGTARQLEDATFTASVLPIVRQIEAGLD